MEREDRGAAEKERYYGSNSERGGEKPIGMATVGAAAVASAATFGGNETDSGVRAVQYTGTLGYIRNRVSDYRTHPNTGTC